MSLFHKKSKLVTHSGHFHADDIFACATLCLLLDDKVEIIRTRDEKIITEADYVFDVGGIHDPKIKRFDHHQKGGAGFRESGTPYAAFGLVWKEYGGEVAGSADIARIVETNLVEAIDCGDNGVDTFSPIEGKPFPYMLQRAFGAFVPVFDEDPSMYDKNFLELVDFAKKILIREIKMAKVQIEAKREVTRAYNEASDKRLIILDKEYYYQDALTEYPEPLFVVAPRSDSTYWKVGTVRAHKFGMDIREKLPEAWAGLRDQALAQVTGVKGSVFCHNARFLCITETKDEALALANLALTSLIK